MAIRPDLVVCFMRGIGGRRAFTMRGACTMSNRSNRSGLASLLLAACCLGACYGDITSPGGGDDGPSDDDDDDDDVSGPLVVSPSQVTLEPGATQGFQATRSGADAAGVTWAVDGDGAITTAGVYTAPGAEGTYTIVATDAASGERAEATVTVAELVATTHGMSIPAAHPRLWFNPSRLAHARTWFAAHPFDPPSSEDSGAGYADVALHGLLTENASGSCTTAIAWALSRLDDVADTGGVACDSCRWTGEQLILVYDWCHAYLSPGQRDTYVAGMSSGLSAWAAKDWGGPEMFMNNYYWGYLRNELEWAITAYDASPTWAEAMLDFVFDSRLAGAFAPSTELGGDSRGGVAFEGSEYGPAVAAYSLVPFTTTNLLGRDVYEETPFWRELVYSTIHATTPSPTTVPGVDTVGYTVFPFSDDESWNSRMQAQTHYYPDFMTAMASYWPTQSVGRHARRWAEMVGVSPWRQIQAVDEPTAPRLLTIHNLWWTLNLVAEVRAAVEAGTMDAVRSRIAAVYG